MMLAHIASIPFEELLSMVLACSGAATAARVQLWTRMTALGFARSGLPLAERSPDGRALGPSETAREAAQ